VGSCAQRHNSGGLPLTRIKEVIGHNHTRQVIKGNMWMQNFIYMKLSKEMIDNANADEKRLNESIICDKKRIR
jgi:hypothetical protein